MSGAILTAEGLTMRFGAFTALDDVSIAVKPHTVHAVIGPNGAGKTTLFNCLAGQARPQAGRVSLAERDITHVATHRRARLGLARSFQVTNLFGMETAQENLRLAAQAQCGWRALDMIRPAVRVAAPRETAREVLDRIGLADQAHVPAAELSHAGQRLLEIGMALAASPRVLLLDEPSSGMALEDIPRLRDLIRDLARTHSVLLIEHNVGMVLGISDTVTVLDRGCVIAEGTPDSIRADSRVRAAYLGGAA